jgi:hypothetical protein
MERNFGRKVRWASQDGTPLVQHAEEFDDLIANGGVTPEGIK